MTAVAMAPAIARVGGQPLHRAGEPLDETTLRQRACSELLRQAAQRAGLLDAADANEADGVLSEAASEAIEALLEAELRVPEPDLESCRRHHAANAQRYRRDERAELRHILFAVTPGSDLAALRTRAEQALLELRCDDSGTLFARRAAEWSNCPSAAQGGALGRLAAADCAPEFAREVFGQGAPGAGLGVLPRLVHTRFGLHIVEVLAREGGEALPFEQVHEAVRLALRQHSWLTALRQYLLLLAGQTTIEGVELDASDHPLVQ